jgi:hypothetical protein
MGKGKSRREKQVVKIWIGFVVLIKAAFPRESGLFAGLVRGLKTMAVQLNIGTLPDWFLNAPKIPIITGPC